jgi:hypothetical protein
MKIMLRARQVLLDCQRAYELLEMETDPQRFRILLVASLALCRSVGQVLDKIDSCQIPSIRDAVRHQWQRIKKDERTNRIYHGFIEAERNLVLKEYEFRSDTEDQTLLAVSGGDASIHALQDIMFCPLTGGPYEGEDVRDMISDVMAWWDQNLKEIESLLPSPPPCGPSDGS